MQCHHWVGGAGVRAMQYVTTGWEGLELELCNVTTGWEGLELELCNVTTGWEGLELELCSMSPLGGRGWS